MNKDEIPIGARLPPKTGDVPRTYVSWRINTPGGAIEGDDIYNEDYPLSPESLDRIKRAVASRATAVMKPAAMQAGHIMPDLPPQTVILLHAMPLSLRKVIVQ